MKLEWKMGRGFGTANAAIATAGVTLLVSCATVAPTRRPGIPSPADSAARVAIANERTIDASAFPTQSVAVVPMNVSVRDTSLAVLGVGLADLLITDLTRAKQLIVVDRLRMNAIIRELQLAASGRVDSVTAPRVGKLVRARRIVVGTIFELPNGQLRFSTRVADTQSSVVSPAIENTGALNSVFDAEKALAFGVLQQMGVTLTPAERAQIEVRPTKNIAALLAYSRGVRADAQGNFAEAANYYRNAARVDPTFDQSKTRATEADARAASVVASAAGDVTNRLSGIAALAGDALNRPTVPIADAANAAFTNSVQKGATIIITVRVP
ncbi:MAG: CsgG/HfaB family protein [Gemmatimonas sp.]